jgi:hypothetical protein
MDVTFSIVICTTLVAIPDGACSKQNALQVFEKPLHLTDAAEPASVCAREAYAFLQSFPRPKGEPLTISWTCSPGTPQTAARVGPMPDGSLSVGLAAARP